MTGRYISVSIRSSDIQISFAQAKIALDLDLKKREKESGRMRDTKLVLLNVKLIKLDEIPC